MCVHVLFPGTAECYYSRDPLVRIIDPYPKSTTDAYWYNSVEPRGKEFWQKVVWTSVERKITELLLNAREGVLHIDHQLKRAGHRYAAPRNSGAIRCAIRRAILPLTDVLSTSTGTSGSSSCSPTWSSTAAATRTWSRSTRRAT